MKIKKKPFISLTTHLRLLCNTVLMTIKNTLANKKLLFLPRCCRGRTARSCCRGHTLCWSWSRHARSADRQTGPGSHPYTRTCTSPTGICIVILYQNQRYTFRGSLPAHRVGNEDNFIYFVKRPWLSLPINWRKLYLNYTKNNLNLSKKTESVTVGADATVVKSMFY